MSGVIGSHPAPVLRDDLRFQRVDGPSRDEGYWVIHDPLATEWFSLSDAEYRLLLLANKRQSLGELCATAVQSLRPRITTMDAVGQFYLQSIRKGILRGKLPSLSVSRLGVSPGSIESSVGTGANAQTASQSGAVWFGRMLAFRMPGINPMRLAGIVDPIARWVARPSFLFFYVSLVVAALFALISQSDRLFNHLSQTAGGLISGTIGGSHGWIAVLIVIAVAKTIHELAHVIACRMVGAECRQLGILLLLGTPCLYCDVSDLWSVPSRRKRVFVSAAGMFAEIGLAAIAVLVWTVTDRSVSNQLALMLVTVCSVSTVLVNANPLLRYDGYFILSDWLGIPNLASRSAANVRCLIRQFVWGEAESRVQSSGNDANSHHLGRQVSPIWLHCYGVASGLYRLFILGVIVFVIYRASARWGLEWIVLVLASVIAIGLGRRWWSGSTWWRHRRPRWVVSLVLLFVATAALIPLPRQECIPVLLVGFEQHEAFSRQTGRLVSSVEPGTSVETGDVIVEIAQDSLAEQNAIAQSKVAIAHAVNDVARASRSADSASSRLIALSQKQIEAAEQLQTQIQAAFDELSVRAPASGVWVPRTFQQSTSSQPTNLLPGQRIDAGTLLGWVMPTRQLSAVGYASATQLDDLNPGQTVTLSHPSLPSRAFSGSIVTVQRTSAPTLPPELTSVTNHAMVALDSHIQDPTRYQVAIEWTDQPNRRRLVNRSVALAWVRVAPKSIAARLGDWLTTQRRGE